MYCEGNFICNIVFCIFYIFVHALDVVTVKFRNVFFHFFFFYFRVCVTFTANNAIPLEENSFPSVYTQISEERFNNGSTFLHVCSGYTTANEYQIYHIPGCFVSVCLSMLLLC